MASPLAEEALRGSDGMLRRESGTLLIEDVPAGTLVERFGSPLFVISENTLRRRARQIHEAFQRCWPAGKVLVMPSVKANYAVAVQRVLATEEYGADLVGAGELEVAVRAGIDPERISLNGTAKDRATLERAVALGARITIDDIREIDLAAAAARAVGRRAVVRPRLRPYVDTDAAMEAFGIPIRDIYGRYKSGIPWDDLPEVGKALSAPELDVRGVMMHMGRYTTDLAVIGRFVERFGELVGEVATMWGGWTPQTIDIGGGFAPPIDAFGRARPEYSDHPQPPPITDYAAVLCDRLRHGLATGGINAEGLLLEVEPGRSLFGPCGVHIATLLNVKRQTQPFPQTWYETDTTEFFLSDVAHSASQLPLLPAWRPEAPGDLAEVRVVGRSCASDVLDRSVLLPDMRPGQQLVFCFTGAYHEAGASTFNVLPRPATVLVNGSHAHLIRHAETIADILARDTVPDHLRTSIGAAR